MLPRIYLTSYGGFDLDKWYAKEVTRASYKEMIILTKWINKIYGYYPIIIGGWAVYSYVPTIGSRDIDLVFPTNDSADKVLLPYYRMMRYKERGIFSKRFYKEVETKDGKEEIELDACSLSDKNLLRENKDIEIPWSLSLKYGREWKIEEGAIARIPTIEVLILYKVKALCDRRYDLKNLELSIVERSYINSKIWKDEHDVKKLVTRKIDMEVLNGLLRDTEFEKYFKREMDRLNISI
jgi:hypothetical protein